MPNQQPGMSMFPLSNRPKQTRRRRKKTTGTSNITTDEKSGSRARLVNNRAQKLVDDYSTSATSSTLGSSSSGSFSSVGPHRNSRSRRARNPNEHYGNWTQSANDIRSPSSTEETTPKTPESWGSAISVSAASPPARRNAISEGFSPSSVGIHPPVSPASYAVLQHTSNDAEFASPIALTSHETPHFEMLVAPSIAGSGVSTGSYVGVENRCHPLNHLPNVSSDELSARVFNRACTDVMLPLGCDNDTWTSPFPMDNQPQHSFQSSYPQAASIFPEQHFANNPMAMSSTYDTTPYPELEPLSSTRGESQIPGGYLLPADVKMSIQAANFPSICMQDWSQGSSTGRYDSAMLFAAPNE